MFGMLTLRRLSTDVRRQRRDIKHHILFSCLILGDAHEHAHACDTVHLRHRNAQVK